MREEYQFESKTTKITIELEQEIVEALQKMEGYKEIPVSNLINVATKRFVITHKDFLPPKR